MSSPTKPWKHNVNDVEDYALVLFQDMVSKIIFCNGARQQKHDMNEILDVAVSVSERLHGKSLTDFQI